MNTEILQARLYNATTEREALLAGRLFANFSDAEKATFCACTKTIAETTFELFTRFKEAEPEKATDYFCQALAIGSSWTGSLLKKALSFKKKFVTQTINPTDDSHTTAKQLFTMAVSALLGIGQKQNVFLARHYLEKASALNHTEAQRLLGYLYRKSWGVAKDRKKEFDYYNMSARQGNILALSDLGYWHEARSYAEAIPYYNTAIEKQGNARALCKLGHLNLNGWGIAKNPAAAKRYYETAAEQGLASAQAELGYLYLSGNGVEINEFIASKWFWLAAIQDNVAGRHYLQRCYLDYGIFLRSLLTKREPDFSASAFKTCGKLLSKNPDMRSFFITELLEIFIETERNTDKLLLLFQSACNVADKSVEANVFLIQVVLKLDLMRHFAPAGQAECAARLLPDLLGAINYQGTPREYVIDLLQLLCNAALITEKLSSEEIKSILQPATALWYRAQLFSLQDDLPIMAFGCLLLKICLPGAILEGFGLCANTINKLLAHLAENKKLSLNDAKEILRQNQAKATHSIPSICFTAESLSPANTPVEEITALKYRLENNEKRLTALFSKEDFTRHSEARQSQIYYCRKVLGETALRLYELHKNAHPEAAVAYFCKAYHIVNRQAFHLIKRGLKALSLQNATFKRKYVPEENELHCTAEQFYMKAIGLILGLSDKCSIRQVHYYLEQAAENGHAFAQHLLGYVYKHGLGIQPNAKIACHYFEQANAQDNVYAQWDIGNSYHLGKMYDNAKCAYLDAIRVHGFDIAQNDAGVILLSVDGINELAKTYFEAAAAQGYRYAQYNLGTLYERGIVVTKDNATAAMWYWLSARQGCSDANERLKSASNPFFIFVLMLLAGEFEQCADLLAHDKDLRYFFIWNLWDKLISMETNVDDLASLFRLKDEAATTSVSWNVFLIAVLSKCETTQNNMLNTPLAIRARHLSAMLLNTLYYPAVPRDKANLLLRILCQDKLRNTTQAIAILWYKIQFVAIDLPLKEIASTLIASRFPDHAIKKRPIHASSITLLLAYLTDESLTDEEVEKALSSYIARPSFTDTPRLSREACCFFKAEYKEDNEQLNFCYYL